MNAAMHPLLEPWKSLIRRVVEIDFLHGHRHLAGSLSALPIIQNIYDTHSRFRPLGLFDPGFVFILSKGHACAALYAVLESYGFHPDVRKVHPERDPANGITITAGSLGHGLPIAVGIALGQMRLDRPGLVHVLMGDGESLEGTTWEALHLAARWGLGSRLMVHVDCNGLQGSDHILVKTISHMRAIFPSVYPFYFKPGAGVRLIEERAGAGESVHQVTPEEYIQIMEELK